MKTDRMYYGIGKKHHVPSVKQSTIRTPNMIPIRLLKWFDYVIIYSRRWYKFGIGMSLYIPIPELYHIFRTFYETIIQIPDLYYVFRTNYDRLESILESNRNRNRSPNRTVFNRSKMIFARSVIVLPITQCIWCF